MPDESDSIIPLYSSESESDQSFQVDSKVDKTENLNEEEKSSTKAVKPVEVTANPISRKKT